MKITSIKVTAISAMLTIAALVSPSQAHATGIPVVDISAIANQLIDLGYSVEEIDKLYTQIQNQVEQIQKAQQQIEAVTGARNLGDLLNSSAYRDSRQYLPEELTDAATFGRDAANSRYSGLAGAIKAARDAKRLANSENYGNGGNIDESDPSYQLHENRALDIEQQSQFARASYAKATSRNGEYQTLIDQINQTNDLKASLDLNSRIAGETLLQMNEIARLLALQQEQAASTQQTAITAYEYRVKANAKTRERTKTYQYQFPSN